MENTRFTQGMEQLKTIDGKGGENVIKSLEDIAPDLGKFIVEFGCEPQLEVHINGALNVGISPEKMIETFLQCIPYTGFPKVLNAVFAAKKVFAERGLIQ